MLWQTLEHNQRKYDAKAKPSQASNRTIIEARRPVSSIRLALRPRGTKAAGFALVCLLTIMCHAFSYQAMLLSVLKAQIGGRSVSPDPRLEIRFSLKLLLILSLSSRHRKP